VWNLSLPPFGLNAAEPVAQIVLVSVEESLFLNEVNEHQPVEHQGRVPLGIGHPVTPLMNFRNDPCSVLNRS